MPVDIHPTVCNICRGSVIYTTNDQVYGKKYGSCFCYLFTSCGAYVGTHLPRPREALGLLADAQMRKGKMMCHDLFDRKWKGQQHGHKKRAAAYKWLAGEMGIPVEDCHFGYFDLEQLRKAYRILVKDSQQRKASVEE